MKQPRAKEKLNAYLLRVTPVEETWDARLIATNEVSPNASLHMHSTKVDFCRIPGRVMKKHRIGLGSYVVSGPEEVN